MKHRNYNRRAYHDAKKEDLEISDSLFPFVKIKIMDPVHSVPKWFDFPFD